VTDANIAADSSSSNMRIFWCVHLSFHVFMHLSATIHLYLEKKIFRKDLEQRGWEWGRGEQRCVYVSMRYVCMSVCM